MELSELKSKERYSWVTNSIDGKPLMWFHDYFSIYSLINKENGKRYIGRTRDPKTRIKTHMAGLKHGTHINKLLNQDAGCEFEVEILKDHILDRWEAKRFERYFMLKFKTYDSRYGYNCNDMMVKKIADKHRSDE